jgi:hypothetical protein
MLIPIQTIAPNEFFLVWFERKAQWDEIAILSMAGPVRAWGLLLKVVTS